MPPKTQAWPINLAINQALNAKPGHKLSVQQAITSALNAKQGHKLSYQQDIGYLQQICTINEV